MRSVDPFAAFGEADIVDAIWYRWWYYDWAPNIRFGYFVRIVWYWLWQARSFYWLGGDYGGGFDFALVAGSVGLNYFDFALDDGCGAAICCWSNTHCRRIFWWGCRWWEEDFKMGYTVHHRIGNARFHGRIIFLHCSRIIFFATSPICYL